MILLYRATTSLNPLPFTIRLGEHTAEVLSELATPEVMQAKAEAALQEATLHSLE
jgi:hypothetical protein